MKELEFIYKRHSVRKFKPDAVPMEHIRAIVEAATLAPSGKNIQNWHFVVIGNQQKIGHLAAIVRQKNEELSRYFHDEKTIKIFRGMAHYHTVFQQAPVIILVYAGPYPTVADDLLVAGLMDHEQIRQYARPNPGIQNIAAAMENLQLAAVALGYGTCWMTGPTYAAQEISDAIGFYKPDYYLAAMTPLGLPVDVMNARPPRKPLDDVLTVME